MKRRTQRVLASSVALLLCSAGAALAQKPEAVSPELAIPSAEELNRDPIAAAQLLMELSERAESAEARHDDDAAISYYLGIARLVPDNALAFSKLCGLYQGIGEHALALKACREATGLPGVKLADYLSFAALLLHPAGGGALEAQSVAELDAVFAHLEAQHAQSPDVEVLMCQLGIKLESPERLHHCLARLEQKLPGSTLALPYRFSLALLERDFSQGRQLIEQARAAELGPEVTELMQRELDAKGGLLARPALLVGVGLSCALGAVLWFSRQRRRTALA